MLNLKYDGKTLQGTINGKEVKVTRHDDDTEDLEKACMMALLKTLGYTYEDIQELYYSVNEVWKPRNDEKYYYISDGFFVLETHNCNYPYDRTRIRAGNCFRTKALAEDKLNLIKDIL